MNAEEFEACLSRLVDGELPSGEFPALEQHLHSNAEARRQYLDYVDLHNILELELSAHGTPDTLSRAFAPLSRMRKHQRMRTVRILALASCALLMIGVLVFTLINVRKQEHFANFRLAPGTVFNVSHPEGFAPESAVLTEGSRMVLDHGSVEITLPKGVRAVVQAPADIVYESEDLIRLDSGTGWFQVPEKASGFQVRAGELLVTDFGTEFGIISREGVPDEAHLLRGKIGVRNLSGKTPERMLEGIGALKAAAGGTLEDIEARPDDFHSSLPSLPPYLHFTFDSQKEGSFPVEGTASATSKVQTKIASGSAEIVPGISGGALRLNGTGAYLETDWPGISGARPRSVACWVRVDGESTSTEIIPGIAAWGVAGKENAKWKVGAGRLPDEESVIPRVSFGRHWFDGTMALREDTWHHLAFIYHGGLLENGLPDVSIYLDGQKIGLSYKGGRDTGLESGARIDTETDSASSSPLLIGKSPGETDTFRGDIDDLYFFAGALRDDAIKMLYLSGKLD